MNKIFLFVFILLVSTVNTVVSQTTIYSEDFQLTTADIIPATWSQTSASNLSYPSDGWKSGIALGSANFTIPSHTRYLATDDDLCNCDKSADLLISPSYDLTSVTYPAINFDLFYYANSYTSGTITYHEIAKVQVSTNGGASWTDLETLAGASSWVNHTTNLIAYAGMPNVKIGFLYSDGGGAPAWMWGMAIDNFKINNLITNAISVNKIVMNKYILAGNQTVNTVVTSFGGAIVSSATLQYSLDGATPVSQVFTPNINYDGSYTANFTASVSLTSGVHIIKSWISDINGTGTDTDPSNDTARFQISVLSGAAPDKKVLVEEYTGAWSGYSPNGELALTHICNSDSSIIGVSIHEDDAMQTFEGGSLKYIYPRFYPCATVDRSFSSANNSYTLDTIDWASYAAIRKTAIVPATVSLSNVSFNDTTRLISATVNAHFVSDVKGRYALNCYVVENRVYGSTADTTDNQWNQHSNLYTTAASPFNGIGTLGLVAGESTVALMYPNQYVHNHVLDNLVGGAFGDTTAIPQTLVTSGTDISKTFTTHLPYPDTISNSHRYFQDNVYIIGTIQEASLPFDKANSYVLNAVEKKLTVYIETGLTGSTVPETGITEVIETSFGTVSVYPNPASATTHIALNLNKDENVSINLYNITGQKLITENHTNMNRGSHILNINTENLANGIYNIVINTGTNFVSRKIIINK